MKKKIIKSVLALLLIITLIIGVVIIYYKTVDIKQKIKRNRRNIQCRN